MLPRVEHELHHRRRSRNVGLLVVLLAFVALVFGLTIVKVTHEADQHIGRVPASQGTGGQP